MLSTAQALGNAIATYNRKTKVFCYKLSYAGLSQEVENASHIHAPADIGVAGPVLFTLPSGANKAACVNVTATGEESLYAERWYFNVHTKACPGGELRGQILKA
jgi:CHRD domain